MANKSPKITLSESTKNNVETAWVEINAVFLKLDNELAILVFLSDIAEKRKTREVL